MLLLRGGQQEVSVNTCTISWITDYLTNWTQCVRLGRALADLVMCSKSRDP